MFEQEVKKAIEVLRVAGTILYPTDTVWGIGCDATNKEAVEKIFSIKKREDSKSMIVLVSDEGMLNRFVKEVPSLAWDLIDVTEKPLTIIYDGVRGLAPNIIAQDGSAGIRVATDEFCKKLIYKFGKPIVSTSANISGEQTPQNFYNIKDEILNSVDYVVNWRQDEYEKANPSSIIKLKLNGEFVIIRQ